MICDANYPLWPTPANIVEFSYSRLSHFDLFRGLPFQSYNVGDPDPAICDLKVYQDYLTYCFIHRNVSPGSRILDVGGGDSRILRFLSSEYECWNHTRNASRGSGVKRRVGLDGSISSDVLFLLRPTIPILRRAINHSDLLIDD